jgi:hypothetical protein
MPSLRLILAVACVAMLVTLPGCGGGLPSPIAATTAPTQAAPSQEPAVSPYPTLTRAATSTVGAEPTPEPPGTAPAPEPSRVSPSLARIDLTGALEALPSYTLSATLNLDTADTGRVSLRISEEHTSAPPADRITLTGTLAGQPVDVAFVRSGAEAVVSRGGSGWAAASAEQVPELRLGSLAQSILDGALAGLSGTYAGTEEVAGRPAYHYAFNPSEIAAAAAARSVTLDRASADAWVSVESGAVIRVAIDLQGRDSVAAPYILSVEATLLPADESLVIAMPTEASLVVPGGTPTPALLADVQATSLRLEATLTITSAQVGTLSFTLARSADPYAARARLAMDVNGGAESLEVIEAGGTTYVAADGSDEWQLSAESLARIIEQRELTWLADPQVLLEGVPLTPEGPGSVEGLAVERYSADPQALLANMPFADVAFESGTTEVAIAPQYGAVVLLAFSASGTDKAGAPYAIALDVRMHDLDAPLEILAPPQESVVAPGDQWPAELSLDELSRVEDLASYRVYTVIAETGGESALYAEILHEVDTVQGAERLIVAAQRGTETAFSDLVRVGSRTWLDDGGTGQWVEGDDAAGAEPGAESALVANVIASLGRAPGTFVALEAEGGAEAARYTWPAEVLSEILGIGALEPGSNADVWVSSLDLVPVRIRLSARSAAGGILLDYAVSDIGASLAIAAPSAQLCPAAASLQPGQAQAGTLAAGARACVKFIAPRGDLRTLVVTSPDPRLDLVLGVYDATGTRRHYNDDGPRGYLPLLTFRPAASGVYYAALAGNGPRQAGDFAIALRYFDAQTTATLDRAPLLVPGASLRAALTEGSLLYLPRYEETIYGHAYALDGQAGQAIRVRVVAERIGSRLDPQVFLLGPGGDTLANDDDGLGGADALLEYTLPETGRYHLVVNRASGDPFGSPDNYYYEIGLDAD